MSSDLEHLHLYTSRPIPSASRCIRVLHVHDVVDDSTTTNKPIECHLAVVNLNQRPYFNALSYVWGLPGPFQLLCDDVLLPITTNCYLALWHLRKKLGAFCIWVDAVCIDQQSTIEKAQQIGVMGDIYTRARKVYIWLGIGNAATERAMAYLAQGGLEKYGSGWSALWAYHRYRWSSKRTMVPEPLSSTDHRWSWTISPLRNWRIARGKVIVFNEDLEQLLSGAWITRIWTYQETLLAFQPIVVSGTCHVPWPTIASALAFLEMSVGFPALGPWTEILNSRAHYRASMPNDLIKELWGQYLTATAFANWDLGIRICLGTATITSALVLLLLFAWSLRHGTSVDQQSLQLVALYTMLLLTTTLLFSVFLFLLPPNAALPFDSGHKFWDSLLAPTRTGLINTICWRSATDPRDMVYGVLPMLQHMASGPSFHVDYSAQLSSVYTDLAKFFLEDCHESNILTLAAEARCPGAPAWVPDFSKTLRPISVTTIDSHPGGRLPILPTALNLQLHLPTLRIQPEISFDIDTVSNFIDVSCLADDELEGGRIHNVSCIMETLPGTSVLGSLYSRRSISVETSMWLSIFQRCTETFSLSIGRSRLRRYYALVEESLLKEDTPLGLLGMLKRKELLDVHDFVCHYFSKVQCCFFVVSETQSGVLPPVESSVGPRSTEHRWLGYVKGQQQGKIRAGDKIVRVDGMKDCVVYRHSEKALIARLPEDQSQELAEKGGFLVFSFDMMMELA